MATYGRTVRRGLPRDRGGEAWPAADAAAAADAAPVAQSAEASTADLGVAETSAVGPEPVVVPEAIAPGGVSPSSAAPASPSPLRRGLPRVAGGEPWPPAAQAGSAVPTSAASATAPARDEFNAPSAAVAARPTEVAPTEAAHAAGAAPESAIPASASAWAAAVDGSAAASEGPVLRRGLPRVAGGGPWPPSGTTARTPAPAADAHHTPAAAATGAAGDATGAPATAPSAPAATLAPAATPSTSSAPAAATLAPAAAATSAPAAALVPAATPVNSAATEVAVASRPPLTVPRTVWLGRAATQRPAPRREPARIGPFTRGQWLGAVVVGGAALLVAAAMAVALVRVLLSMPFGQDFLAAFPGEYHLPEAAPVGFPAWLGWQHFFNAFLMVLIIRTGLTIRAEKRPAVFWTPRRDPKGKTSLTIWFHQALDVLWLVNGVVFLVLLFVTGQWMRIVPTSWEVFPNALSAALQYVSLDWPTENGWVNYNSLQQLAYFATVFIAAPLAAITGYRMSGMWPKDNARLTKTYPVEWARRIHFPVMLYFVVFIAIHVALVFATGALRNLNHMYAAQGSVDGVAYADNWTGFWMFVASLVVIAAAWVAARPLTLAPIARLFGTVSGR
jgi:thiosulfate reductase cytochrome b subunit